MSNIFPYFTNDGSVGLYNNVYNDIYHSASGALTEAFEKFILPIDFDIFINKNKLNVLDICYVIGYNTKALLSTIYFQKKVTKYLLTKIYTDKIYADNKNIWKGRLSPYIDTLHDDKISALVNEILLLYNCAIYGDNFNANNFNLDEIFNKFDNDNFDIFKIYNNLTSTKVPEQTLLKACSTSLNSMHEKQIYIKAIDSDKALAYLSPFIITGVEDISNQTIDFDYQIVEKYLTNKQVKFPFEVPIEISIYLLSKLVVNNPDILTDDTLKTLIYSAKYSKYFSSDLKAIFEEFLKLSDRLNATKDNNSILHNIYYSHISNCYKTGVISPIYKDVDFELNVDDARKVLQSENRLYDIVFLDAFTPSKCPCLWSIDFFKLLYEHLSDDGIILTYSSSANIRNAFLNAGFYIGKIYSPLQNKFTGTLASKNKNIIKFYLSNYELGLLNTRAGIYYKDENLSDTNEEILAKNKFERENSNLISSSSYVKNYKIK